MSTNTISRNGTMRSGSAGESGDVRTTATVERGVSSGTAGGLAPGSARKRVRHDALVDWRRPVSAPFRAGGTGARVSTAVHRQRKSSQQSAPAVSNSWVVAIAAVVLILVGGAAFTVRGMGMVDISSSIEVVEVQSGDTLGSIAARNAPGLAVGEVVGQIRAMNDLAAGQVQVGQSLRVPVTAGR